MKKNKIIIGILVAIIIILIAGIFVLNSSPNKIESRITITSDLTLYEGETLTIELTDINSTPIANQNVNVTMMASDNNFHNYTITTDINGTASLELTNQTSGNYTIKVKYDGNENYTESNTTQTIEIKEKVVAEQTQSSDSSQNSEDDSYWETSPDANTPYHTEYYSDGGFRQYDPEGRLVGSSYDEDQEEVGSNVGYRI